MKIKEVKNITVDYVIDISINLKKKKNNIYVK